MELGNFFPTEYGNFSRNGNLYLEKIVEKDREYFLNELKNNSMSRMTFSLKYRIKLFPTNHPSIFLMFARQPLQAAESYWVMMAF